MMVSQLSFGCHNLTGGSSWPRSHRLIRCAVDLGIRRFDVAPSYGLGTAERTLSRALGPLRFDPRIEITTKYGIAPPRFGRALAWLREPYRALSNKRTLSSAIIPSPQLPLSANFVGTARGAAEASLRALRVERIGAFLSHERLNDDLAESFANDMLDLKRAGLVGRVGCSGEVDNVTYMSARAIGVAEIAQVSWRDRNEMRDAAEVRLFNIASLARQLAIMPEGTEAARDLADVLPGRLGLDGVGALLAATLVWLAETSPRAVLIINASTEQRLAALVEATQETALERWASTHLARIKNGLLEAL